MIHTPLHHGHSFDQNNYLRTWNPKWSRNYTLNAIWYFFYSRNSLVFHSFSHNLLSLEWPHHGWICILSSGPKCPYWRKVKKQHHLKITTRQLAFLAPFHLNFPHLHKQASYHVSSKPTHSKSATIAPSHPLSFSDTLQNFNSFPRKKLNKSLEIKAWCFASWFSSFVSSLPSSNLPFWGGMLVETTTLKLLEISVS